MLYTLSAIENDVTSPGPQKCVIRRLSVVNIIKHINWIIKNFIPTLHIDDSNLRSKKAIRIWKNERFLMICLVFARFTIICVPPNKSAINTKLPFDTLCKIMIPNIFKIWAKIFLIATCSAHWSAYSTILLSERTKSIQIKNTLMYRTPSRRISVLKKTFTSIKEIKTNSKTKIINAARDSTQ